MLNSEQQAAVDAREGYWAVAAGPGSGKTRVIVERYEKLVRSSGCGVRGLESGQDWPVAPRDVITLTFTQKAAEEMRKRAEGVWQTVGRGKAKQKSETRNQNKEGPTLRLPTERPQTPGLPTERLPTPRPQTPKTSGFMTFHALALAFASIEREHFPYPLAPFPLATPPQVAKLAGPLVRKYGLKYGPFLSWVSKVKREGKDLSVALGLRGDARSEEARWLGAYREYEVERKKLGILDYDDLLVEMQALLYFNAEVRSRWQFKFVQVDESQDADQLQWQIVRLISEQHKNVMAVGDANQCVYGWRGAHPELFANFAELFPGAKTLLLPTNYRSTKRIVALVKDSAPVEDELIRRFDTPNEEGEAPVVRGFASDVEETKWVVDRIQDSGVRIQGPGPTTAILSRTNRYLRLYEDLLSERGIRYSLLGKSGFWQQEEVKAVLAFAAMAQAPNDAALYATLRTNFEPLRFVRKKELAERIKGLHAETGASACDLILSIARGEFETRPYQPRQHVAIADFLRFLRSNRRYCGKPASEAITGIIQDLRAFDYYEESKIPEADNDPAENLRSLGKIAATKGSLGDFLNYARRVTHASVKRVGVALGTVHAAKGLEWDNVFLVGAHPEHMPHKHAENWDEEKRIFFVAVSRAAKRLFITYCGAPSPFLKNRDSGFRIQDSGESDAS